MGVKNFLIAFFAGTFTGFFLSGFIHETKKEFYADHSEKCPYCGYFLDEDEEY